MVNLEKEIRRKEYKEEYYINFIEKSLDKKKLTNPIRVGYPGLKFAWEVYQSRLRNAKVNYEVALKEAHAQTRLTEDAYRELLGAIEAQRREEEERAIKNYLSFCGSNKI